MSTLCCIHAERSRSPSQPNRLRHIDPIFTLTTLPANHPHAVHVQRPPSVDQTLIRTPSIVSKLKSRLQRKNTSKSLKSQIYDADLELLTSEDVLERIDSEESQQHGRSPSSDYSIEDMLAICRVFDGSTETESQDQLESSVRLAVKENLRQIDTREPAAHQPENVAQSPACQLDRVNETTADSRQLSLPRAQSGISGRGSIIRSSTSKILSVLQSPSRASSIAQAPNDIPIAQASGEATATKDLLTPGDTFADYERKLSVCGDDRRWSASRDVQKSVEVKEEDRAATGLLARMRSNRATSQASNTLMQNALERQLREKALFRSPSKVEIDTPSFVTTTWSGTGHHDEERDLDPLDARLDDAKDTRCKPMGPPESWCRWSSYDRGARAGTAGIEDDVLVRDFATPQPYADRGHLRNPTVMKLKNVKRYYTDLFTTSGFHGKGHRTSIWGSGGKLRDPELEMLPPSMPTYANGDPPDWVEEKRVNTPTAQRGSVPTGQRCSLPEETRSGDAKASRRDLVVEATPLGTPVDKCNADIAAQADGVDDMSAEQLSAMYSDCVSRPFSPPKITRYPSATVIDDRKGHWRSISLISEKSFLRQSSHDLLELVEREKARCERLVMG